MASKPAQCYFQFLCHVLGKGKGILRLLHNLCYSCPMVDWTDSCTDKRLQGGGKTHIHFVFRVIEPQLRVSHEKLHRAGHERIPGMQVQHRRILSHQLFKALHAQLHGCLALVNLCCIQARVCATRVSSSRWSNGGASTRYGYSCLGDFLSFGGFS
jgi:hypothetical protein